MDSRQWNGSDDRDSLSMQPDARIRLSKPIPQPKQPTRKQEKAKADRREDLVKQRTRAFCVERDGDCIVIGKLDSQCEGESEWMHLAPRTRAHTRNMPPEFRHSPELTAMGCTRHHDQIDGRRKPKLVIRFLTDQGMNGPYYFDVDRD